MQPTNLVLFCVLSAEYGDLDPQLNGSDYLTEFPLLPKAFDYLLIIWTICACSLLSELCSLSITFTIARGDLII